MISVVAWLEAGLFLLTAALAGVAGFFAGRLAYGAVKRAWRLRLMRRKESLEELSGVLPGNEMGAGALESWAVNEMALATRRLESGAAKSLVARWLGKSAWLEQRLAKAGLAGAVSSAGFWETRLRFSALGCALGFVVGLSLSFELALILLAAGAVGGWQLPKWAVGARVKLRADQMERHLAEMLDVVALGLRSGLSFERSLSLYLQHFDTMLARSFKMAQQQWTCGFLTREEALRQVAASYESVVMSRVVEDVVRSLRFGSSLAENLELAAAEVRASYRSKKEERVAKAPVKMMVPTGALILPAMLVMVLGPVLLELMEGF